MTRRHFIRAAEIVRVIHKGCWEFPESFNEDDAVDRLNAARIAADAFETLFRTYNDRFDRDRFLAACLPEDN